MALIKAVQPLCVSMACFGLLWRNEKNWFKREKYIVDLCTIHCCFTIATAWCNAISYFGAYYSSDTYGIWLFQKMMPHFFAVQMALGITCHIFHHYRCISKFYLEWECYRTKYGGCSLKCINRLTFTRVFYTNILLIVICIIFIFLLIFKAPKSFTDGFIPLSKRLEGYSDTTVYIVVHCAVNTYLSMVWFQTIIHCITIMCLLQQEFEALTREFSCDITEQYVKRQFQQEKSTTNIKTKNLQNLEIFTIENYRQRHNFLCILVAKYDEGISLYLLFLYVLSIPIIVLLLYATSGLERGATQENVYSEFMTIISLLTFVNVIIFITISASNLATEVRLAKYQLQIIYTHLLYFIEKFRFSGGCNLHVTFASQ